MKNMLTQNIRAVKIIHQLVPNHIPISTISALISAITPALILFFSARIINELISTRELNRIIFYVAITLGASFTLSVISAILTKYSSLTHTTFFNNLDKLMGTTFCNMDYTMAENPKTHELIHQIKAKLSSSDLGLKRVYWYIAGLLNTTLRLIASVILLVGMVNVMPPSQNSWVAHPAAMLIVVALFLLNTLFRSFTTKILWRRSHRFFAEMAKSNTLYHYYGSNATGYIKNAGKDIRLYNQKDMLMDVVKKWQNSIDKKQYAVSGIFSGMSAAANTIFSGAVYVLVGLRALLGMYSIGSVVQYVGAITMFSGQLSGIMGLLNGLKINTPPLEEFFSYLDMPKEKNNQGNIPVEKRTDNEYEIVFRNVSFKYPGSEDYALSNLNLNFRIGQRLAVVGMNGSGKTTMIKLLCRLYDPTEGEILLNGIDIRKYRFNEYMAIFSVVFQDFGLFDFSLAQNVATSAKPELSRVAECIEKVGFSTDYIKLDSFLHKGFDYNGIGISGGEAQKIAMARALYKNAPFIVLDEPTAALDPIAEYEIYSKFDEIVGNKTAIYISHRLSSCRFCDDIAVFHQGELVQRGSHDQLVANIAGKYHELWNAQAQYYA